ncbi:MAG: carbamoyltransferase HypF [Alphaproteobacteria bacterium]|nr:carbamoyltransferase HypF [Alphaproteobacteria bacterium]
MSGFAGSTVATVIRLRLTVSGVVQGVGFRPFVYRLAEAHGLAGHVLNASDGVRIEVEGPLDAVETFAAAIPRHAPANARIDAIRRHMMEPAGQAGFCVLGSEAAAEPALRVPPDLATCPDCVAEVLDPANRRYRYALTNCTACGPRFSILDALPYDRHRTAMRGFGLCADCRAEYGEPLDRRFHAEPIACSACGPQLALSGSDGVAVASDAAAIAMAAAEIAAGGVVAVKGLGGYHLAVDATSDAAVARLRRRKRRPTKPLAVMVPSLAVARALCRLGPAEEAALQSPAAPIVLAPKRHAQLSDQVAPQCAELGLILPYTPLHHLLMRALARPLVVTSGNRSGEPILYDDRGAQRGLASVTDRFLSHTRPIRRPVEDSVVRTIGGAPQVLRLGRGLAPDVLALSPAAVPDGPAILALGGYLKTAPVLLRGHEAILGPHVGDQETAAAEESLGRALEDLQSLHNTRAAVVACDRHPDYPTTHLAEVFGLPVVRVQHHAAHIASVIAEHGLTEPVLGIAWDGTGYGLDGTVWGGEALWMTPDGWHRVARLRPFPLPGGEQAVREPRRALYGLLHAAGRLDLLPSGLFSAEEQRMLAKLLDVGVNAPATSSMGRLFDALAALLGLGAVNRHEGEAAAALEHAARRIPDDTVLAPYAIALDATALDVTGPQGLLELDWRPMLGAIVRDLHRGRSVAGVARSIHEALASAVVAIARARNAPAVALSGGCFQNRLLLDRCMTLLAADGRRAYVNRRVPPGDGGLALGQAFVARQRLAAGG